MNNDGIRSSGRTWLNILTATVIVLSAALVIMALVFNAETMKLSGDITQLRQQNVVLRRQADDMRGRLDDLSGQVATLNVPSDPLSAYNQICNQLFTNSLTGNDQTYYFPCTNNVLTIPRPGQ